MPLNDTTERHRSAATVKPFQIRGRFFTAVALRPEDALPDETFYNALDEQLQQTPQFFANAPLILDLELATRLTGHEAIKTLVDNLRRRKLQTFGVQNATEAQIAAAAELGLIPVCTGHDAPLKTPRPSRKAAEDLPARLQPDPPPAPANLTITQPVRSGQTVFADQGDLIVIGPVSSGAELIAAGNIHVYGHLRGRAMAGVNGDRDSRIFCQSLDAELLAIAGRYRTSESLETELQRRSVQIFLEEERLCVEALG